jgi:hypothetical protein
MNLLKEMQSFGIPISKTTPMVYCKLFEDNVGAIQLAKVPREDEAPNSARQPEVSSLS